MSELVTTQYAVRVMGRWVRRADALLHEGALGNAAQAVREEQQRSDRQSVELAALDLRASPAMAATG